MLRIEKIKFDSDEERQVKIIIGIDPGKTGAIAFYEKQTNQLQVFDFQDMSYAVRTMGEKIYETEGVSVGVSALESVHSMPKQGVASSFKFGANFGFWQGVLISFAIPYELVTPQKWQKVMLKKSDGKDTKERSLNAARRLFPEQAGTDFRLKKHNGRSDATLLAVYASRMLN